MKKVLVIRFSSLGDIVLTTPVLRSIKSAHPDWKIFFATKEVFAPLLSNHSDIDGVLALEKKESLLHFIRRIRLEQFDIVLDLHANLRSFFIRFFSRAVASFVYNKAGLSRRLFVRFRKKSEALDQHTVDRYLGVLKNIGVAAKPTQPALNYESAKTAHSHLKILVIQTAFLGDAVLTLPLFEHIKRKFRHSILDLLTTPQLRDVYDGSPHLNSILEIDKKGKDKSWRSIFDWSKKLKSKEYDVAILPHRSLRTALLAWLADIPIRIGFDNSQGRWLLTDRVPFEWNKHDVERNLALLDVLGKSALGKAQVQLPAVSQDFIVDQLLGESISQKQQVYVGVCAGSVWKTKRWLPEYFAQVCDQLAETLGAKIILVGGKTDAEASSSVERMMKSSVLNLAGKTDLKSLITLLRRCDLFLSNDSGPMHIAGACNVPVVAVFGPTTRALGFFPYGERSRVLEVDLSCRPCSLHGGNVCPKKHFKCMKDVKPEMVYAAAIELLKESSVI